MGKNPLISKLNNAWYAVTLSRQVKPGQHIKVQLLNSKWVLFRTHKGSLGMTSRFCCHLGTDLSNGSVDKESLVCPMHGWQFDAHGQCRHIPNSSSIPKEVRLSSFNLVEKYGIIFAYYGDQPLFDFPDIPELSDPMSVSSPGIVRLPVPYFVPSMNTFDTQHYDLVHSRRFVSPAKVESPNAFSLRISYTAEIMKRRWIDQIMAKLSGETTSVVIESWGGGLLMLKNKDTGYGCLIGICPSSETSCELYMVAAKEKSKHQSWSRAIMDKLVLNLAALMFKSYLKPDFKIIRDIQVCEGTLLEGLDDELKLFYEYWRGLPKIPLSHSGNGETVV